MFAANQQTYVLSMTTELDFLLRNYFQLCGKFTDEILLTMFEAITDIGSLQHVEDKVTNLTLLNETYNICIKFARVQKCRSRDEERSLHNSLLFLDHPKNVENDNYVEIMKALLVERLNISPDMCIQRAHRIGNLNRRCRRS